MGKVDIRHLDVVGVCLTVEKRVVDAEFETLDASAHEYLACDMAEEPAFEVLAKGGV